MLLEIEKAFSLIKNYLMIYPLVKHSPDENKLQQDQNRCGKYDHGHADDQDKCANSKYTG